MGQLEQDAVLSCFHADQITQGPMVEAFEEAFAQALDVQYAVACSSGTSALHLAIECLRPKPGGQILVPDLTFIATGNAVLYSGLEPVFVDVDPTTWCIDVADARRKVTTRTVGIIPVHLYGTPCDLDGVASLAADYGLFVIEDAAEGLGGYSGNRPLGTYGDFGTFSFYGNKVITTGEGGMVVTSSKRDAERLRLLRGQGQGRTKFQHEVVGFNYRMTDMQGAIGVAQLTKINDMLYRRKQVVDGYRKALRGLLSFPEVAGSAPWLFTGLLPPGSDREAVMSAMADKGIETRPSFVPMHLQPCYRGMAGYKDFVHSVRIGARGISLPTYPEMDLSDVALISVALKETLRELQYD